MKENFNINYREIDKASLVVFVEKNGQVMFSVV